MRRLLLQIYAKNRAEAFDFYKEAFDAEIGYCEKADDGTIIHAELNIVDKALRSVNCITIRNKLFPAILCNSVCSLNQGRSLLLSEHMRK